METASYLPLKSSRDDNCVTDVKALYTLHLSPQSRSGAYQSLSGAQQSLSGAHQNLSGACFQQLIPCLGAPQSLSLVYLGPGKTELGPRNPSSGSLDPVLGPSEHVSEPFKLVLRPLESVLAPSEPILAPQNLLSMAF